MDYPNNHSPYSRWASEAEIKASLHKIALDDNNTPCGGIPLSDESTVNYIARPHKAMRNIAGWQCGKGGIRIA